MPLLSMLKSFGFTPNREDEVAKSRRGKRYPVHVRKKILAVAEREKLTAEQVQKRFGVSRVTFYKWRGPVGRGRRPGTPPRPTAANLEREVRTMVRSVLPRIIRQEVNEALKQFTRRRGG
jgi:transposase-like protein